MTEAEPLRAWHGSANLKAEVLARVHAHRRADEIMQGTFQVLDPEAASGYRGCLIGCTLPVQPKREDYRYEVRRPINGWHAEVQRLYGIDQQVGAALDVTFESLDPGHCADFAVDSIEAIPVGAALTTVVSRWVATLMDDPQRGLRHALTDDVDDAVRAHFEVVLGINRERAMQALPPDFNERVEAALAANAAIWSDHGLWGGVLYAALGPHEGAILDDIGSIYVDFKPEWAADVLLDVLRTAPVG